MRGRCRRCPLPLLHANLIRWSLALRGRNIVDGRSESSFFEQPSQNTQTEPSVQNIAQKIAFLKRGRQLQRALGQHQPDCLPLLGPKWRGPMEMVYLTL